MATRYFEPKAIPVAQVSTVQVTAFDASTTYTLTVNGIAVVAVSGDASVNATATALQVAWEAATHPYASGITATVATDTVTLTGDTEEVPFVVVSSVAGGSGTIGSVAESTAPTGPHTIDDADNWDGGTLPSNSDVLVFRDLAIPVCWGLAGISTTGHTLKVDQSYSGKIGLDRGGYATSADGQTTDLTAQEYREVYLQLDCERIEIGGHQGIHDPGGSQRIMIDNDRASASTTIVHRTSSVGSEQGKPPVRLLYAHASADLDIRSGSIGIATDAPGETSTIGDVTLRAGTYVQGDGVTSTNFTQHTGTARISLGASTLTQALVHGGDAILDGDQIITTLKITGGRVESNTTGTIATVTHDAGTLDLTRSSEARTVTTYTPRRGATLIQDDDVITITNFNRPDGPSAIAYS